MSNDFLPLSYELPTLRMTLKTREPRSKHPRAPVLGGFVAVDADSISALAAHLAASGESVMFLDVALWPARDPRYVHEGAVTVKSTTASEPATPVDKPPVTLADGQVLPW
jgi:hypothetical protein